SLTTNITIHNGDTAVLGGLIRDQEDLDEQKVPILGDIPLLGWLFRSKDVQHKKINLLVFMTPKIIRTLDDGHKLLSMKTNERIDWLKKNFDGLYPFGAKVDSLPRAAQSNDVKEVQPINIKSQPNSKIRK